MNAPGSFADPAGGPALTHDRHGADLGRIEIDSIVTLEELPDWIWEGTAPVPVERIAEDHFGLLVMETDDPSQVPGAPPIPAGNHFSGFLLADRGEIWVNAADAREWPPRKRFTIAHELAHWRLHRHLDDAPLSSDDGGDERPPLLPLHEAEANAWAAALLMPAFLLRPEFERTGGDIARLQVVFSSSQAALERRLRTLGLSD